MPRGRAQIQFGKTDLNAEGQGAIQIRQKRLECRGAGRNPDSAKIFNATGAKMEKDEKRKETIRVFRKFARLGLDDERINPIQAYRRIDVLCSSRRAKLDMLAVYDALRLLNLGGEEKVYEAVRDVYFEDPGARLNKNEVSRRVARASIEYFCDERTVYRRLERARSLYSQLREKEGLIWDGVNDRVREKYSEKLDNTIK